MTDVKSSEVHGVPHSVAFGRYLLGWQHSPDGKWKKDSNTLSFFHYERKAVSVGFVRYLRAGSLMTSLGKLDGYTNNPNWLQKKFKNQLMFLNRYSKTVKHDYSIFRTMGYGKVNAFYSSLSSAL